MATSVYPATGGITNNTTAANFIPEIWSDEIIAAYKKELVIANLVNKMPMAGKKGDTIHIPKPTRGSATAKAAGTAVTIQNETATQLSISLNKHFEYSRMIEDITDIQAQASMRKFYTGDAGYALAKKVEDDIFLLGQSANGGNGSNWAKAQKLAADGTLSDYSAATTIHFNDAGFRNLIQKLDDADVPMDGRSLVLPPSARNAIMGIDRYTSSDFVSGNTVVNGKIGNLYGVDVYISNNCPTGTGTNKIGLLMHKDAFVFAEQMAVRSQTQYKQEFLADLFTSDTIYGTGVLRDTSAVAIALPA
jgi:N4-gp56 family major capsid protein